MLDKDLSELYQHVYKKTKLYENILKETPQTAPAPAKPSTPTKPSPDTNPSKPRDPFFPKPGQSPRPKAGKGNVSVQSFIKKRTTYKK